MQIIRETSSWIAVHKPAGLAVQTRRIGEQDLTSLLLNYLQHASLQAGKTVEDAKAPYLAVIHRLDQPVEGIVLFAKTPSAAAALSAQLQNHQMKKEYLACVQVLPGKEAAGITPQSSGGSSWHTLTDFLRKDGRTNTSQVAAPGTPSAKKAVLDYQVLSASGETAVLRIRLHTGRHHQIRVQLAHAGMPILGDRKYGRKSQEAYPENGAGPDRFPALCACRLSFTDPDTRTPVVLETEADHERLRKRE